MKRSKLISLIIAGMLLIVALPGYGLSVTGKVFLDGNSDGVMQVSEAGIANTAVSDGRQVVITDGNGSYKLETEVKRFVFVSLPKGYQAMGSYYHIAEGDNSLDFPMSVWAESGRDSIRFLQITDLHIKNDSSAQIFLNDIADVRAMNPRPAFVIASGDLVDNAENISEFESLMKAVPKVSIPLFLEIGNHDVLGGNENYKRFCGPRYYSFNAGNCHFIILDSTRLDKEQKTWVDRDLAMAPKNATRIFIMHYLPTRENMRFFASLDGAVVLSGHWHGVRTVETFGVLSMNTPPFRFGGLDRTPASFRVMDVKNGNVTSELRLTGQQRHATIVTPVGRVSAPNGEVQVLVNAYDTWAGVESVECRIGNNSYPLTKKGPWSWVGKIPVTSANLASQYIAADVYDSNGKLWSVSSRFQVDMKTCNVKTGTDWGQWHGGFLHQGVENDVVRPPLRMVWAASTGGMIGISSPMVSDRTVTVGVADTGNLESCGVAAFDVATGEQRWYYLTDSAIKGSPAIAEGKVFAISISGNLYALDLITGKLLWRKGLFTQIERWEVGSPVVVEGVIYAGGPTYLAAFEANTGKLLWERSIQDSVDKKTGNKLWDSTRLSKDDWVPSIYTVPTPMGDKLLVPTRGGLFAVERATGEPIWKVNGRSNVGAVSSDGILYTTQNMFPSAIKVDSGETLWTGKNKLGDCASTPAVFGDKMVIGTDNGRVCAFSTKDGVLLWSFQTGKAIADTMPYSRGRADVNSSPVISGDTVYFGGGDGCLYAVSLATGKKLWSYSLGVPIISTPAISGNTVFVTGYDGNLYAFTGHN